MKITRKNYFDEFSKADKSKLPKAIVETHELISQATSDGKTWDFFDSDPEMKEVELLQLEKFEQAINSIKQTNYKGKKVRIQPATKNGKVYIVWDIDTNQKFANENFNTISEAKKFVADNKMDLKDVIYSKPEVKKMLNKYAFDPKHPLMVIDMDSPQFQSAYKEFLQEVEKYDEKRDGYWELLKGKISKSKPILYARKHVLKDGFEWAIISSTKAKSLFDKDLLEIFLLDLNDDTESLVESADEMKKEDTIAVSAKDAIKYYKIVYTGEKQSRTTKPKKKSQAKKTDENIKYVENIDVEIQLINRYKNLHGKTKTRHAIVLLLRAIQRAIVKRQITKKSVYAKEISIMQDELIKVIQEIDKLNLEIVEVELENINKYEEIARSEKRMLSVTYILRYIAISKQHDVFGKAKRLLDNIKSAIEKRKITKRDKYYDDLDEIKRRLSSYVKKEAKTLAIQPAELSGLKKRIREDVDDSGLSGGNNLTTYAAGILSSIAARYIYDNIKPANSSGPTSNNNVTAEKQPPVEINNAKSAQVLNSEKLKTMKFETIKLDPEFAELIGEPSEGAAIMIYGGPGSGKSTFEVLFGKSLAEYNDKKVLIITDEEGFSKTMQEKLDRLDAYHKNIFIAEEIPGDIKSFDVVFFDSVQSLQLTPEQLEKFHKDHPRTLMVFVFQVTKDGKFKGEEEFEHIVDVVLHADQGIVTSIGKKNRFGGRGELQVY
ncbi:MAG: AAA family ATPase [Bacteroidales bacterium]|jgi:hypothetical protein|nr:AAA family ATPase [Bacteroidales bacterium]